MGVGRLDMYVLNPVKGTKELEFLLQQWAGDSGCPREQDLPLQCLTSVCALLVWHPVSPSEKIIRVLFPGCTPQGRILEGLEKVKHLEFLKHPVVTKNDLKGTLGSQPEKLLKQKRAESKESLKSASKLSLVDTGTPAPKERAPPKAERKEVKVGTKEKPKPLGETARAGSEEEKAKDARAKLDSSLEKLKVDVKPKLSKEKVAPKKEPVPRKEEKKPLKKEEGAEAKKEAKVPKKEAKAEPPRKESKAEAKAPAKTPVRKTPVPEPRKPLAKAGSIKKPPPKKEPEKPKGKTPREGGARKEPGASDGSKSSSPEEMLLEAERGRGAASPGAAGRRRKEESTDEGITTAESELEPSPMENGGAGGQGDSSCLENGLEDPDSPQRFRHLENSPLRAVCPPSPLARTPKSDRSVNFDLTPTGMLNHGPEGGEDSPVDNGAEEPGGNRQPNPWAAAGGKAAQDGAAQEKQAGSGGRDAPHLSLPTLSDSDVPPATEDCPSLLADGLESDEDSEQPPRGTARPPIPAGTRTTAPPGPPVYVDLAYLPGSWSARTVDEEFFRRVRSLCYVVSGDDHLKEGVLRPLLDALLAGRHQWGTDTQVTLIPTFDSLVMHEWYQETHDRQQELGITVLGSNSTVAMQDETFPACKVEF
ncbi:microtubule-associated protein 1S [Columba livia]|uniref:Microtubule-associated protein 1S n=1 Tax=Columba livia TaxID=8932 RepID=A0A2I0LKD2_COLLI|nr:microtubule-associated protein 1S [Columba livia]